MLYGLGIREVGSKTAQVLAKHYPAWQSPAAADQDELAQIDSIGPIMAQFIQSYFPDQRALGVLERLAHGVIAKRSNKRFRGY